MITPRARFVCPLCGGMLLYHNVTQDVAIWSMSPDTGKLEYDNALSDCEITKELRCTDRICGYIIDDTEFEIHDDDSITCFWLEEEKEDDLVPT